MDIDTMELDDLGIPETSEKPSECTDCGARPESSPLSDAPQVFHYDNCFFMNPDNFVAAA